MHLQQCPKKIQALIFKCIRNVKSKLKLKTDKWTTKDKLVKICAYMAGTHQDVHPF